MDGAVQPGGGGTLWSTIHGLPYKIKMKKVGRGGPPITQRMELEAVGKIMDQPFPQAPALVVTPGEVEERPLLLMEGEIYAAVDRVCTNAKKALGPDGILKSVWTIRANSGILNTVFNVALKSGVAPTQWKMA